MALTYISATTIGAGAQFSFAASGDQLVVLSGVTLASTSGAVLGGQAFDNLSMTVLGTLATASGLGFTGLDVTLHIARGANLLSMDTDAGNAAVFLDGDRGTLLNDGTISSSQSVALLSTGGNLVTNSGEIQATSGVFLGLFGASGDRLTNSGRITANQHDDDNRDMRFNNAVHTEGGNTRIVNLAGGEIVATSSEGAGVRFGTSAGNGRLNNAGTITSVQHYGVSLETVFSAEALISVVNTGTISGGAGAYLGSTNADRLVNRGLMLGDVAMGAGNDTLDARGGTVEGNVDLGDGDDIYLGRGAEVSGTIAGGAGNDTMSGSAAIEEVFDGGTGVDTLDFRFGGAATLALDNSFESDGAAAGDSYTGFERVTGSARGDMIRGNASANVLNGLDGADTLDGADGADVINGGHGADVLTGGMGNDSFRYMSLDDFGDQITDFRNASGNNDRFQFSASGLGGGLAAGALAAGAFISRTDNLAQDADDRFIFRTTDQTLWYDADGSGAGAALMVAALQPGITLTSADIVLI